MDEKTTSQVIQVFSGQVEFLKEVINDLRKKLNNAESTIDVLEMEKSRLEDDVDELVNSGKFYVDECRHLRKFINRINNLLPISERMEVYWEDVNYNSDEEIAKKLSLMNIGPETTTESGRGPRSNSLDEK